ncbi:MAG: hypothetical protein ACOCWL_03315 [Thermoguttaceae bacterium]
MPIRFHCKRCEQLLGIASRKVGSEIECPKCGFAQTVPTEEAAAVAMALRTARDSSNSVEAPAAFAVYDDAPEPVEVLPPRGKKRGRREATPASEPSASPTQPGDQDPRSAAKASPAAKPPEAAPPVAKPKDAQEPDEPTGPAVPGGMILFPRRTLYVQGVLVTVLALVFFGTGYFIGRGSATLELELEHEETLRQRTLVEGRLVYRPEPQRVAGDEGAVIVALPTDAAPETPLTVHGIRPQDPNPPQSLQSLRLLGELGGAYARANAEGHFDMIVPDQGEYYILLISRNAGRPRGTDPDEADLLEIGRYFTMPERLISRYKYRWKKHEVHGGMLPIEIDFGEEGRE